MAVRDDFSAGEVLSADDLNDTFASKLPYAFSDTEPTTTVEGFLWYDTNFDPPVGKVWDGTAFVNFSQGPADFSDSATGTYTDDGVSYKYLTFTASGTLTVTRAGFADVLVVGGGGAGGQSEGGGGGAGGHLEITDAYLPAGSLTVTVGAGGASRAGVNRGQPGQNGNTSRIADYYSSGGGAGTGRIYTGAGSLRFQDGFNGGSGGGGSGGQIGAGGSGIAGLGNDGASGLSGDGGGGGGAGAAATNRDGGAGKANGITDPTSPVTRAGGGGGGGDGAGGSGGGGAGDVSSATSGTANTGGGGGGAGSINGSSGAGGSGVVIVRVKV